MDIGQREAQHYTVPHRLKTVSLSDCITVSSNKNCYTAAYFSGFKGLISVISLVSLLVDDYDAAIDFFTRALDFRLVEDSPQGNKRWVVVAPADGGTALLLAKATTAQQQQLIGEQGAGRVWLFLQTNDFDLDYQRMRQYGVEFCELPRHEPYGTVAVFRDICGNKWDLIERKKI